MPIPTRVHLLQTIRFRKKSSHRIAQHTRLRNAHPARAQKQARHQVPPSNLIEPKAEAMPNPIQPSPTKKLPFTFHFPFTHPLNLPNLLPIMAPHLRSTRSFLPRLSLDRALGLLQRALDLVAHSRLALVRRDRRLLGTLRSSRFSDALRRGLFGLRLHCCWGLPGRGGCCFDNGEDAWARGARCVAGYCHLCRDGCERLGMVGVVGGEWSGLW